MTFFLIDHGESESGSTELLLSYAMMLYVNTEIYLNNIKELGHLK